VVVAATVIATALAGATTVAAKKDGPAAHVPPGQAKKAKQVAAPGAPAKAPKAPKPAKAPKPPKVRGPKKAPPAPVAPTPPAQVATPTSPAAAPQPTAPQPAPTAPSTRQRTTPPRRSGGSDTAPGTSRSRARSTASPIRPTGGAIDGDAGETRPTITTPGSGRAATPAARSTSAEDGTASTVTRTVRDIVETVPGWMKLALGGLLATSLLLGVGYLVTAVRARSLARQRGELLSEVGLLQRALLPPVPRTLGALRTSAAYRPADGPGAGGDFYDALTLPGGRAAFVLGDVSGHGRDALERTAFMRYTLRAYLEAGLEPRVALQVAERAIGERLGSDFATVLLAIHDPRGATLTWASAGHPAPIVVGDTRFRAVTTASSPPIGVGVRTGLRQTTLPLTPGSLACLYTDGLIEARTEDGGLLGGERLEQIVADLAEDATATDLIAEVARATTRLPDDMAAFLLTPTAGVTAGGFRREQLELSATEASGPLLERFLADCMVAEEQRDAARHEARALAGSYDGVVVSVSFGTRHTVTVLPSNVESIATGSVVAATLTAVGPQR